MTKTRWMIIAVLMVALTGLAACGGDDAAPPEEADDGATNEATENEATEENNEAAEGNGGEDSVIAEGEQVVQQSCISCHGDDLSGGSGPAIHDVASRLSEDEIYDIVENGQGSMPGGLADGQEEEVTQYLLSLE